MLFEDSVPRGRYHKWCGANQYKWLSLKVLLVWGPETFFFFLDDWPLHVLGF